MVVLVSNSVRPLISARQIFIVSKMWNIDIVSLTVNKIFDPIEKITLLKVTAGNNTSCGVGDVDVVETRDIGTSNSEANGATVSAFEFCIIYEIRF